MARSLEKLDCKIPLVIGNAKVMVAYKTFMQFKTLNTMCEDLGLSMDKISDFSKLPCICDASNIPINFTTDELTEFIKLFELCSKLDNDVFINIMQNENIEFEKVKKYLILINFLDNQQFLNCLCKYASSLLRNSMINMLI
jgi:hypothetical protein